MKNSIIILKWIIPYELVKWINYTGLRSVGKYIKYRAILNKNKSLKDRHVADKRSFILCNGPSTKDQNLLPLKNEYVISVSSGYLFKDFDVIAPKYHCVPQITYGLMKEDDVVEWFNEMDSRLGDAELFLSLSEYELVQKYELFPKRKVYFLCLGRIFSESEREVINLASIIPGVGSVPIMALMVAMYLGFKEIYLLGTDHDSFQTNKYVYAFEPTVLRGKDCDVRADGQVESLYKELHSNAKLWENYRSMRTIAESNGIKIINATKGGALDEFERVDIENLFQLGINFTANRMATNRDDLIDLIITKKNSTVE
jgi:hypothetical protein